MNTYLKSTIEEFARLAFGKVFKEYRTLSPQFSSYESVFDLLIE